MSLICGHAGTYHVPAFPLCNFNNKAVQMQTMMTVRDSIPTFHKSGHKKFFLWSYLKN